MALSYGGLKSLLDLQFIWGGLEQGQISGTAETLTLAVSDVLVYNSTVVDTSLVYDGSLDDSSIIYQGSVVDTSLSYGGTIDDSSLTYNGTVVEL